MYIWLLQCITLYQRRKKVISLNIIEYLETSVFINNLHWQSSGILLFLRKYFIVISNSLVGSFLDVLFLLVTVILSELREKLRKKDWVTGKSIQKKLPLFWLHALLSMPSYCFLRLLSPPNQVKYLQNSLYKDTYFAMGGILCDDIMSKRSKIWKSPIIWYYTFFFISTAFPTRPQCCLAFSWTELQMLLRCYLIHITIIIHFIFYI